jgi:hypothetical protein
MEAELLVCKENIPAIPPVIPCFGATEEQDCAAVGIGGRNGVRNRLKKGS